MRFPSKSICTLSVTASAENGESLTVLSAQHTHGRDNLHHRRAKETCETAPSSGAAAATLMLRLSCVCTTCWPDAVNATAAIAATVIQIFMAFFSFDHSNHDP